MSWAGMYGPYPGICSKFGLAKPEIQTSEHVCSLEKLVMGKSSAYGPTHLVLAMHTSRRKLDLSLKYRFGSRPSRIAQLDHTLHAHTYITWIH